MIDLRDHIRAINDFPKPGIVFRDIGTLLANGTAWRETVDRLTQKVEKMGVPDVLLGIESRGFLVAAPVAARLGTGVVMVRKKGKLPGITHSHDYDLEYGQSTLEIQQGLVQPGNSAVVMDDLLATGGTAAAAIKLARKIGLNLQGAVFIIELVSLKGRAAIDVDVESLVQYEG